MYTANVVDTGPIRAVGKPPGEPFSDLKTGVTAADATLHLPARIYAELGGNPDAAVPSGSEYVDGAVRDDWVTVSDPLPGRFDDGYDDAGSVVERARHDAHRVIARTTNHPKTVNEWDDTAIVGLAMRLFERNERIRVIVHTTDRPLAKAVRVVVPNYGYYDVKTRYYPPQTAKERFPVAANFTW